MLNFLMLYNNHAQLWHAVGSVFVIHLNRSDLAFIKE